MYIHVYICAHIHTYTHMCVYISLSLYIYIPRAAPLFYFRPARDASPERLPRPCCSAGNQGGDKEASFAALIYLYISLSLSIYIYVYVYIHRQRRERERERERCVCTYIYIYIYIHVYVYTNTLIAHRTSTGVRTICESISDFMAALMNIVCIIKR